MSEPKKTLSAEHIGPEFFRKVRHEMSIAELCGEQVKIETVGQLVDRLLQLNRELPVYLDVLNKNEWDIWQMSSVSVAGNEVILK